MSARHPDTGPGDEDDRRDPAHVPPPQLVRALGLLDTLLLRDDLPSEARLALSDVHAQLLDLSPADASPAPATSTRPWTFLVDEVTVALGRLIAHPDPGTPPATAHRHAHAVRALQAARHTTADTGPERRQPPDTPHDTRPDGTPISPTTTAAAAATTTDEETPR
ncbi:hypothetical protein [Aquipuribacter hungaricus]|uniref:Uncharacterized protein n=1 Tax=Aquipuribacter hungaricus TaxID=545624 RepID=A0ABV7WNP5_9MICO